MNDAGMLDLTALIVLHAMMSNDMYRPREQGPEQLAAKAYKQAAAMQKERAKWSQASTS